MLRIAVACPAGLVAAWQQRCIDILFSAGFAVWVASIETDGGRLSPPAPPLFDIRALRAAPLDTREHAPQRLSLADPPRDAPVEVDVLLTFDARTRSFPAVKASRGTWYFSFGGADDAPPCFRECLAGDAVTEIALLQRAPDGSETVLRRGAVAVMPTSLHTTVERTLDEASSWPALACSAIAKGASIGSERAPLQPAPAARPPSVGNAFALSLIVFGRRIARIVDLFSADKWNVGVVRSPIERFLHTGSAGWPDVEWLPEPHALDYLADPFGAAEGTKRWALVERFDAAASRGTIEAFEFGADGWRGSPVPAMSGVEHMSYPFLLQHEDQWYCIPESFGGGVSLYRALELPARWERVANLVQADAVDATILRHDGRWWLFYTDLAEPRHHRLSAFYADDLRGPYVPHPLNPVKSDPRSAGCAGTPFVVDGVLYRPAQDCSRSYGGAITINRIVELTPLAFREEPAATLSPNPRYPAGVHTLSACGDATLVDGKRRALTFRRVLWRLTGPLRRLTRQPRFDRQP